MFRLFWLFLPEPAIARNLRFQHLLASRFLSDAGQQSLAFGALVSVTRGGASSFEVSLVGVAVLLPPAVLGLYGGAVADALPKRVALAGVYSVQALLCFLVPIVLGTELFDVLFLLLAVNSSGTGVGADGVGGAASGGIQGGTGERGIVDQPVVGGGYRLRHGVAGAGPGAGRRRGACALSSGRLPAAGRKPCVRSPPPR